MWTLTVKLYFKVQKGSGKLRIFPFPDISRLMFQEERLVKASKLCCLVVGTFCGDGPLGGSASAGPQLVSDWL